MKRPYVVAVTGGRDYNDAGYVKQILDGIHAAHHIDVLVQGGATGADSIAKQWADINLVQLLEAPVTTRQWRASKSSGPTRNSLMLLTCRINQLVAFPGGRGTTDCVTKANAHGITVLDLRGDGEL